MNLYVCLYFKSKMQWTNLRRSNERSNSGSARCCCCCCCWWWWFCCWSSCWWGTRWGCCCYCWCRVRCRQTTSDCLSCCCRIRCCCRLCCCCCCCCSGRRTSRTTGWSEADAADLCIWAVSRANIVSRSSAAVVDVVVDDAGARLARCSSPRCRRTSLRWIRTATVCHLAFSLNTNTLTCKLI